MISQQGVILSICNIVIFIAVILSMFVIKKSVDTESNKTKSVFKNIAVLIMFLLIMVMQVYSLNCMVNGDCQMWAWALTAFAVFGTLGYIGFFAYITMTANKVQDSVKDLIKPSTV
jgi:hypothetical protein